MSITDYFKSIVDERTINITKNSWIKIKEDCYKISKKQFNELWELHPKEHHNVVIMGKEIPIPRYQDLYSNDPISYSFTGSTIESKPIPHPVVEDLLKIIQNIEGDEGAKYNAIFVNWYDGGEHYIGAHSDDEKDLVEGSSIYSFSFGDSRVFRITGKGNINYKKDLLLKDGMMVVMGGDFQKELKHSVLKKRGSKEKRINFTVRAFHI